jgi:probable F420-dependent oxidoreductase
MMIGCSVPVSGPLTDPDSIARIATEAEALGFDYVTVSDHIVIPADIESRYPYSDSGEFPSGTQVDRHEQLMQCMFIAAVTTKLRIVTSVMVVPHRPAMLTAKLVATLDVLSKGRLTLGIGVGWMEEEFIAVGTPPFAERGAVTDEYMMACKELWTKEAPTFEGKYTKFSNVTFRPKPVQKPHPPIWIGGESGPALRRTARYGDAWYPIGTNPAHPMNTITRYKAGVARVRKFTEEAGRDPASVAMAYRVSHVPGTHAKGMVDGERRLFSGDAADFAGDIAALRDVGVTSMDFGLLAPTLDGTLGTMRRFRDEVMTKLK